MQEWPWLCIFPTSSPPLRLALDWNFFSSFSYLPYSFSSRLAAWDLPRFSVSLMGQHIVQKGKVVQVPQCTSSRSKACNSLIGAACLFQGALITLLLRYWALTSPYGCMKDTSIGASPTIWSLSHWTAFKETYIQPLLSHLRFQTRFRRPDLIVRKLGTRILLPPALLSKQQDSPQLPQWIVNPFRTTQAHQTRSVLFT